MKLTEFGKQIRQKPMAEIGIFLLDILKGKLNLRSNCGNMSIKFFERFMLLISHLKILFICFPRLLARIRTVSFHNFYLPSFKIIITRIIVHQALYSNLLSLRPILNPKNKFFESKQNLSNQK
jgi:hypothetical protein